LGSGDLPIKVRVSKAKYFDIGNLRVGIDKSNILYGTHLRCDDFNSVGENKMMVKRKWVLERL
jgi:hypothetical protein